MNVLLCSVYEAFKHTVKVSNGAVYAVTIITTAFKYAVPSIVERSKGRVTIRLQVKKLPTVYSLYTGLV